MSGHTGVMIDYAHLDFEENVAKSKKVVEICHLLDAWVEAELGTVPRTFESDGRYAEEKKLTDPTQAARFVELTGLDALAISVGEESGLYTSDAGLDIERLREIRNKTNTYLIMHGGSGTPPDQIKQVVENGVVGVRFATEIRIAFFDTMEKAREKLGHDFPDTRKMQQPAREAVKLIVKERMKQMGSMGQACTDGLCPPILNYGSDNTKPLLFEDELDSIVDLVIKSISN
jgi:ketose-bisphosphate aldolase